MSFLGRRKSQRPFTDSANFSDAGSHDQHYNPGPTPSIKSTSTLRNRLSSFSILGPKRKRSQASKKGVSGGIGYNASYRPSEYGRSRSPSPEPSLEIRRPSGLGRRASITGRSSARHSEEELPKLASSHVRKKSISTPDLLAFPEGLVRWAELSETEETADEHMQEPVCMFSKVPSELLRTVFAFVAPPGLACLSRTCKTFVDSARTLLYRDINLLPGANEQRLHACIDVLASRRDLASLVQQFSCGSVPKSAKLPGRSPFPAVTFAIALSNMTGLTSLTLPRFDPPSFFYTTFQLRSLTLLCETATADELQTMFAWLVTQPSLAALSFPHLVLDNHTSQLLSVSGAGSPSEQGTEKSDNRFALSLLPPSRLLPKLNHILGPSCLVAALTPGRPLTSLTMHVHSTIYDGLRPSALMAAAVQSTTPVLYLSVVTTSRSRIDARTLDRVLMAAGALLGPNLKSLEIETSLEDEVFYKQLHGIIPRFPVIHTLCLRRSASSPYLTPPPTPSSTSSVPFPSPVTPMRPRTNTVLPTRTQERALLGQWSKQCCTLRNVTFPSGGRWRITEGIGGVIFTYLGGTLAIKS